MGIYSRRNGSGRMNDKVIDSVIANLQYRITRLEKLIELIMEEEE